MKIINIDSKYEITQLQISAAKDIVYFAELHNKPHICDTISRLMRSIPIFLVSPKKMQAIEPIESWHSDNGGLPPTEWLGVYKHSGQLFNYDMPAVFLCPERIRMHAANYKEAALLTAKVIIHEYAHALMHAHPGALYQQSDDFYKWMEEPMANLITLNYFAVADSYGLSFLDQESLLGYAKDFISKQPPNYRLGLDLFEHGIQEWWAWRNCKADIEAKTTEKNDWLNYARTNVGKTDKSVLTELFRKLIAPMDLNNPLDLASAATLGKLEEVRSLIEKGLNVNAIDCLGRTALMWAASEGHAEIVRMLLKAGADIHATDQHGWTTLMLAVQGGYTEIVHMLIYAGANVNAAGKDDWTALVVAAYYGHTDVMQLLLTAGADFNRQDKHGKTAIDYAKQKSRHECVSLLEEWMEAKASDDLLMNLQENQAG